MHSHVSVSILFALGHSCGADREFSVWRRVLLQAVDPEAQQSKPRGLGQVDESPTLAPRMIGLDIGS